MSLHLDNTQIVPPGGFRYKDTSTGVTVTGPSYKDWVKAVKAHKTANNIPFTSRLEEEMQEQLCQQLPIGWCVRDGMPFDSGVVSGLTFDKIMTGTATLGDWLLNGGKKVAKDEAQRRANVCGSCPFNQQPQGCSSCNQGKLLGLVNRIVGGEKLQGDDRLHACTLCGCSLKAKVWLEIEVLQRHTGGVNFPEWCWLKKENQ